ncbi:hypothetical protein EV385_5298 [Krasilnikovia cinnamomea]|uniref:Uncharacterized protein n=1 Tax=Krasilnikovia cinnamomea TaxID=349313 RepID=A0A4Q7ZQJ3_9ACTN|nr:hypothetical protein EV385_5298 [Krasilnikovia cinnamomea]
MIVDILLSALLILSMLIAIAALLPPPGRHKPGGYRHRHG